MNPDTPSINLNHFISAHVARCSLCIKALEEMETYVATTGEWPEGAHGLLEHELNELSRRVRSLRGQVELPF